MPPPPLLPPMSRAGAPPAGSTAARFGSTGGTTSRVATASTSAVSSSGPPTSSSSTAAAGVDLNANPQFVQGKNGMHRVVSINNGRKWVNADNLSVFGEVTELPKINAWYQKTPTDERVAPGNANFAGMSRLDAFMLMMPPTALEQSRHLTEQKLRKKKPHDKLTTQEWIKFLGVCLLMTRIKFNGRRQDLWTGDNVHSKYLEPQDFSKTGMSRHRFDEIWYAMTFSKQPEERPEGMSQAAYRWMLVDDFVTNFNQHRASTFVPGGTIIVDETMVRWYGMGGLYVEDGLPMYVSMDRKPDSGLEVQDACCVDSNIMIQIKVVDRAEEEERREKEKNLPPSYTDLNHGTKVLLELLEPWKKKEKLVLADSYFASVQAAMVLKSEPWGLDFIGNVKTCTQQFPMKYLDGIVMGRRGDRHALASLDETGT